MRRGVLVPLGVAVCLAALAAVAYGSFGGKGRSVLRFGPLTTIEKVVAYPGSRTLLLGHFHGSAGLVRVTANGSRDATFGDHGLVRLGYGSLAGGGTPKDVAVGPSGRIAVAGWLNGAYGGDRIDRIVVDRFLPDGRPDPSFGSGGRLVFGIAGGTPETSAVAIGRDGKIYIGGSIWSGGARPLPDVAEDAILRLLPSGRLDPSYGTDGVAHGPAEGPPFAMAVAGDGSVLVPGADTDAPSVVRFDRRGRLDRSFAGDGVLRVSAWKGLPGLRHHLLWNAVEDLGVTASGRIVLAGSVHSLNRAKQPRAVVVALRFLPDGRFDRSFGGDGVARMRYPASVSARALAVEPGGRVVVAAEIAPRQRRFQADLGRFCFEASGRPDRLCGRGGRALTDFGETDLVGGVALQPSGRAVLVGTAGPSGHERSQGGPRVTLQRFRLGPGAVR